MTTDAQPHVSVLLQESLAALAIKPDGIYLDATFGRGGHSRAILSQLNADGRLYALDRDPTAIAVGTELQQQDPRFTIIHTPFSRLAEVLDEQQLRGQLDGILFDLGVSSPQIDDAERGFSFMRDGPLDMRMDTTRGETAAQWLAAASETDIREVIKDYGEERFAFQIAKAIAARRAQRPFERTLDLAELVASVVRTREKGQHPATRTFQAIRIYLNQELEELALALAAVLKVLATGGRLAVISFHSLEDRMVKQCIAAAARPAAVHARLPIYEKDMPQPILKSLGRVLSSDDESKENVRSRSAVLRVAERTATPLPDDQGASFVTAMSLIAGSAPAARKGRK